MSQSTLVEIVGGLNFQVWIDNDVSFDASSTLENV